MNSLLDLFKSILSSQVRTGMSLVVSYALLFFLAVFSWILLDSLFIVWYGNTYGSFEIAIAIVLGLNLVIMTIVYFLRESMFAFLDSSKTSTSGSLNSQSFNSSDKLADTIHKVEQVNHKENSLLTHASNFILLFIAKLIESNDESEDNAGPSEAPLKTEGIITQQNASHIGVKIIDKYLEKRLEKAE
jgi:hypothetical protein